MINKLNYFNNLLNIFLIFIYFFLIKINVSKKGFELLLIFLLLTNLLLKLYYWYNFNITRKKSIDTFINNTFFNDNFIKLSILIFSVATPIFMIFQKDTLIINLFVEKLSFLLVCIFSLVGFCLEFFILESRSEK